MKKLLLALAALALLSSPVEAAIAQVDLGTAFVTASTSGTVTAVTVDASSELLLCGLATDGSTPTATLTWDSDGNNQSLTALDSFTTGRPIYVFYLKNPGTATNDTVDYASLAGTDQSVGNCAVYSGVDLTSTFDTVDKQTNSGSNCDVSWTGSDSGDWAVAWASIDGAASAFNVNTTSGNVLDTENGTQVHLLQAHDPDGADDTIEFGWTMAVSAGCMAVNMNVASGGGGSGTPGGLTLLGVGNGG